MNYFDASLLFYFLFTGNCIKCGCPWEKHHHITYENETNLTHVTANASLSDIDQLITSLRKEQEQIRDVYRKLARFLHANAILPLNDDIIEYLKQFIREEQMKQSAGAKNSDVIDNLQIIMKDYENEIQLFKETIKTDGVRPNSKDVLQPEEIFPLVGTLFRLPINGKKIREQVDGLKYSEHIVSKDREIYVKLPAKAETSTVMLEFVNACGS